jgi:hypothetical protein
MIAPAVLGTASSSTIRSIITKQQYPNHRQDENNYPRSWNRSTSGELFKKQAEMPTGI